MYYEDSGPAADPLTTLPLVLMHAFPLDSRMWDGLRNRLRDRVRLITPDQRGFGRSPLPAGPDDAEASMGTAAADVLALLDDLGVRRAVFGGCSMGGYVAMAVLRAAPHRVAGLVLTDTRSEADNAAERANRVAQAARAESDGITGWLADGMVPGLLGATTRDRRPDLADRVRALIEEQPPSAVRWALAAMAARPDSGDLLAVAGVPGLVVVGEEDTITPPEFAVGLAARIPAATLVRVPGSGHLAALEDPAAVAEAITGFLSTLDG